MPTLIELDCPFCGRDIPDPARLFLGAESWYTRCAGCGSAVRWAVMATQSEALGRQVG